ncbi:unnamed protein product, partial [Laminaria digitata]
LPTSVLSLHPVCFGDGIQSVVSPASPIGSGSLPPLSLCFVPRHHPKQAAHQQQQQQQHSTTVTTTTTTTTTAAGATLASNPSSPPSWSKRPPPPWLRKPSHNTKAMAMAPGQGPGVARVHRPP